jgi:predicted small lipoprotein YifL
MTRFLLIVLLAFSLASCARTVPIYVHPTKSIQEFYADTSHCQAVGGQAGGFYDRYGFIRAKVYKECMYGAGWVPQRN